MNDRAGRVACVVLVLAAPVVRAQERATVTAGQLPAPFAIRLDGVLSEPEWSAAAVIPDLPQQSPHPLGDTPYRTEVRILSDARNLYFGVTGFDPEPGRIAVHTMIRDGDMVGDDSVAIVLDPFGDRRTGYLFRVNASGARLDGLIAGPEDLSLDWDGIWDARTARTSDGWTAEIVIPARSLRFPSRATRWGLNVERFVPRDRTTLRWSGTTLDSRLEDVSRAGSLEGIEDLSQGDGWTVSPYGLGRFRSSRTSDSHSLSGTAGGDVSYNFTPQLFGVLTVKTDFAETEVDTRQIQLTRFPLFFPEKRTFFVEGSNLFRFGLGLNDQFIPFYSRRVGLFQGEAVPLDAGIKVLGRAGPWGIAALDVETGSGGPPRTNLFAGRITYDVDAHLRLGAIATRGDPDGVHDNSLGGLDAVWRTSTFAGDKNLSIGLWGAGTHHDPRGGRSSGWGMKIDYPNDLWDVALRYNDFGEALDPALGFLPRPGTRQYDLYVAYQPRPQRGLLAWVRQFFFEVEPVVVTDLHGQTESWRVFTAPFNVRTQSGEHLEANWAPQYERLSAPFEIARGVVIPVGTYRFDRIRLELQSSDHRPLRVGSTVWLGRFFDGTLTQLQAFANWTSASGRINVGVDAENDFGRLPGGRFIQRLWQVKTVYAFTTELIASVYGQYDSDSRQVGLNARLRWTLTPGRDLFLVWNRNWKHPVSEGALSVSPLSDEIVAKIRWTFRR